ncbi:MAG: hypothetical protein KDE27_04860 [Planctomycetes bacterium]|nr:hypothetical protein [Planctomycetota bacterium]
MKTHAVIEIEERNLTLTIGATTGDAARVFSCDRFPLAEVNQESITRVLRALGTDPLRGALGVHVVVGDRRATHFVATAPTMPERDLVRFVGREAVRLSSVASAEGLLLAPRLLRRLPDGRLQIAATALPRAVWQPIERAFEASGMEVLSLHTTESCLALAAAEHDEYTAVLAYGDGRARFVYCDGGAPAQVRRFILGGMSDAGAMALAAQLAIELPRTYDWLREQGHPEPKALIVGRGFGFDEDSLELLRGDLDNIGEAEFEWELPDGPTGPRFATLMLLAALFREQPQPSLLAEPTVRVPWSRRRVAGIAAIAAVGLALGFAGVVNARRTVDASDELVRVESDCVQLEQQAALAEARVAPAADVVELEPQLELALSMRRPVSRLLAELSNSASDAIHVESLQFASTAKLTVAGLVRGETRQQALAELARFVAGLRALPYLEAGGQDEVKEVPGKPECLRFVLDVAWRNS